MLSDIQWWLTFLPQFHRVSLIKPSFWDFESLNFSTDACLHGGGSTCRTDCISFVFPDCISPSTLHINALELFTIVVAFKHWALQLSACKLIITCDNSAAVMVKNSTTSKDPFMQRCLRQHWLTTALFDFEERALHVPCKHNQFVDRPSRWHSGASARDSFYRLCSDSNQFFYFQAIESVFFFRCCMIIFVLFCFVFIFLRPLCGIRRPTASGRCLSSLQCLVSCLIPLAYATFTQKNMAAHIRSYQTFCKLRTLQSFPISVQSISLYIAYLVTQKRAHGTILSHLSSLKHANKFAEYGLTWSSDYHFQRLLRVVL